MGMLVFRKVTKRGFSNLAIQEWKELWDIVLRSPALLGLKQGLMFIAGNAEERIRASASWSDKRILKVPFQTSGPRFLSLDSYHPSWDNVTPSSQFPCWFYLIIKSWKRGWWQWATQRTGTDGWQEPHWWPQWREHSEVRCSDRISAPSVTPQLCLIKIILKSHLLFLHFTSNAR